MNPSNLTSHQGRITQLQRFPFVVHEGKVTPALSALVTLIRQQRPWQHLSDEAVLRALRARLVRHGPRRTHQRTAPAHYDWVMLQLEQRMYLAQLQDTQSLQEGDEVQLVQANDDPLQPVLAIQRPRDGWLWLRDDLGYNAQQVRRSMWLLWLVVPVSLLLALLFFRDTIWSADIFALAFMAIFLLGLVGMVRNLQRLQQGSHDRSTLTAEIMAALQVPQPERFMLTRYRIRPPQPDQPTRQVSFVYDFGQALRQHRERLLQE
ncbi:hypothetical protein [Leeia aquatica]|uniref:Uncharacterized protein n=1 Tax=Leeia aquatica TaxID=2725557 RepID=A0A847SAC5_9NEIS|nr:hypothetical protein [Leeia aquatica]NLR74289.1 hypothetical protein [Leeia aquatica]